MLRLVVDRLTAAPRTRTAGTGSCALGVAAPENENELEARTTGGNNAAFGEL